LDEKFQLRIILIGHTGFIGSYLYRKFLRDDSDLIGINSKIIQTKSGSRNRQSFSFVDDLNEFITERTTVINTAWCNNSRKNRNSVEHNTFAESEIELISFLRHKKIRYLSLGTIAEYRNVEITDSFDSKYAENKRKVSEYLSQNHMNYIWVRIASCFGEEDKRNWFITELLNSKSDKEITIQNPNYLLNLTSVQKISEMLVRLAKGSRIGEVNLAGKYWYRLRNLADYYYRNSSLDPVIREFGPFSISDPARIDTGDNNILEFLNK